MSVLVITSILHFWVNYLSSLKPSISKGSNPVPAASILQRNRSNRPQKESDHNILFLPLEKRVT